MLNPTEDDLNAAFAEKVAGWKNVFKGEHTGIFYGYPPIPTGVGCGDAPLPRFTQSTDAVMPWLARHVTETGCLWSITVRPDGLFLVNQGYQDESGPMLDGGQGADVEDKSLPRAIVIALLRARGVVLNFT